MLISTQAASNSASLQFTNLPTNYNTLFLNCAGLLTSSNSVNYQLFVGEGAGPTWETASHYTDAAMYIDSNSGGGPGSGSSSGPDLFYIAASSTTIPTSFKIYIDNVGSSSTVKLVTWQSSYYYPGGSALYTIAGSGYWNNDTNPITGLEIVGNGGNIASGTCSLYGMN